MIKRLFSFRTRHLLYFDYLRWKARVFGKKLKNPPHAKLHLGCGFKRVEGWHNVDVLGSDQNVDLACGKLPWNNEVFDLVISQQVIEHLEIDIELEPLLKELHRCMKEGGEIWLACPDMEKVCRNYMEDGGASLVKDRISRHKNFSMNGVPDQHIINILFHQNYEHRNLFDFELLKWLMEKTGFSNITKESESSFNTRCPDIPQRHDDYMALYVKGFK